MQRLVRLCAPAILILGLGLTGCDSNDNAAKEPAPVEEPAADQDLIEPAGGGETTMPGYAKPASSQFALPVPEDWAEHEPFKEEKLRSEEHKSELQSLGHLVIHHLLENNYQLFILII